MIKQLLKFGSVGIANTILDFAILNFLVQILNFSLLPANTISFSVAVVNSFFWNKYWTFQKGDTGWKSEMAKFILIALVGLLLSNLFFYIFTHAISVHYNLAKLMSAVIILGWNFTASKWIVFR